MMVKKTLGSDISLIEIKECARQKKSIEFLATENQVNFNSPEVQDYLKQMGCISLPPLINKHDIVNAISIINPKTDSLKWDYIILITYLNDGVISYKDKGANCLLVTLEFQPN